MAGAVCKSTYAHRDRACGLERFGFKPKSSQSVMLVTYLTRRKTEASCKDVNQSATFLIGDTVKYLRTVIDLQVPHAKLSKGDHIPT
jgi:hypothetical protein